MNSASLTDHLQSLMKNKTLVAFILIFVIALIAYSNSFHCAFHFDDFRDIRDNKAIQNFRDIASWWKMYPSRSIAMGTFALNYMIHGNDVTGFHIVNFIIHVLTAVLVYWLIWQTLHTYRFQTGADENHFFTLALIGALIFAVHPVQTQAVTYIVQRMASLATMFYLLSLNLYIMARTGHHAPVNVILILLGSFVSALAGMLTKQIVFTLPVVAILYDLTFITRQPMSRLIRQKKVHLLLISLITLMIIIPMRESFDFSLLFRTITPQQGHIYFISGISYLLTQFRVIVTYIRMLFAPLQQNLDYDYHIAQHVFELPVLLSSLGLLALVIVAIVIRRRHILISFGIVWFFTTLAVESSVIPLPNVIFEHRLYLPSVGFVMAVIGIFNLPYLRKYTVSIFALVILTLTTLTYQRNNVWKSELTLWTDVVQKSPNKARAHYNLGLAYHHSADDESAISSLQTCLQLNPDMFDAINLLGIIYLRQDQFDDALTYFNKALEIKPKFPEALNNRALIYLSRKNYAMALENLNQALEIDANYALAYQNRGDVYKEMNEIERALQDYNTAIDKDPSFARAYYKHGLLLLESEQYSQALGDFVLATKFDNSMAKAHYNKGICLYKAAQYDEAIAAFTAAIEADPTHEKAYYNRSLVYAYQKKQYRKAWDDLQQAKAHGYHVDSVYYNALAEHFLK